MLFAPNLSMLWADLPLPDRFERAARAGFGAVELWWPGAAEAEQRTEGDLTTTLDAYWHLISHIQIADVPGRHEPGTGEINYRFVLDHLDRKGYQGAVGLEYRPSDGLAEDSFRWLERLGRARRIGS